MAMEFATTAPAIFVGVDDSWQPSGSRSFLFATSQAILWCAPTDADWSSIAYCIDCHFWRHWHARALRPSRRRANSLGEHLSLRNAVGKFDGVLPLGLDRAIHD